MKIMALIRKWIFNQSNSAIESKPGIDLMEIEGKMKTFPQIPVPTEHIFSGGVYVRQVMIPAGTLVMGKRHRFATCNILLKGVLSVYVDETKPPVTIRGPHIFTSQPGAKKFAYCIEDAVFINVLPTNKTDPDEIEQEFIISDEEYLKCKGVK